MNGGQLIREARRRAGLTQRELAGRAGTTQSAIARIERGATEPSYARVGSLVEACGFELIPRIGRLDESDWSVASANLLLSPEARVGQHRSALRFARAGREALARARV
jgi:transcriptional regulator with XRE-family HTH domain